MQKGQESLIIWSYIISKENTLWGVLKDSLKCIVGSLTLQLQSQKFLGKDTGRRLLFKEAHTCVSNKLFIVQEHTGRVKEENL